MIYDEPRFRPGGDRFLEIEFGDELKLELNFRAQGLGQALTQERIKGVIEIAPFFASALVHYDPDVITFEELKAELLRLINAVASASDVELPSRLIYMPAMYLDPWSAEAIDQYIEKINPAKERDPDFVARINGLEDAAELVRVHSGTEYWVAALGFWPGTPFMMPLDPRCRLFAPKYNPPRTFTYTGTIGMGGGATAIYPVDGPGGYQIFARTPVPIWDMQQRLAPFKEAPYLLRPTDRMKFVPCTREEFDEIHRKCAEGSYEMNVVGYQKISLQSHRAWVATLDLNARF
ncbi:MAG: carboxyltransferase domain-containing protein [Gammaproteobacteria bacterium]|nr:carboxyltransferase domain-containing protein [Gammaproteobacteria bacterium]